MKLLTAAIALLGVSVCAHASAQPATTGPQRRPPSTISVAFATGPVWPQRDLVLYANRSIAWSAGARWRPASSPLGINVTASQSILTHSSRVAEQLDLQLRTVLGSLVLPAKLCPGVELEARISLGAASLRASAPRAHRRLTGIAYGLGAALRVPLTRSVHAELSIERVSTLAPLPKHRYLDIGLTSLRAGVAFPL